MKDPKEVRDPENSGEGKKFPKDDGFDKKDRKGGYWKKKQRSPHNSSDWYEKSKDLSEQAESVSTAHINGFSYSLETPLTNLVLGRSDAGVMSLDMCICPGRSESSADPFNQAMINIFNVVRGKYTSNVPFQANDLGCYFLSVGSILACIGFLKRALGDTTLFKKDNKDISALLLYADGFTTSTVLSERINYAQNLMALNLLITKLECLALPKNISFFERCAWMFAFHYYDDEGALSRGNYYCYRLPRIYRFSSTVVTHDDPSLKATGLVNLNLPHKSIRTDLILLDEAIDALVNDDNARQISGWLMQYYKDFVFTQDYLKMDEKSMYLAFSEEVASQFRNARLIDGSLLPASIPQDISKQGLYLPLKVTDYLAKSDYVTPINGWLLNYPKRPNNHDIMTGTRLTPALQLVEGPSGYYITDLFVPIGCHYTYIDYKGDYSEVTLKQAIHDVTVPEFQTTSILMYTGASPCMFVLNSDATKFTGIETALYHKDYTFEISAISLTNLHRIAILSQFDIPATSRSDNLKQ